MYDGFYYGIRFPFHREGQAILKEAGWTYFREKDYPAPEYNRMWRAPSDLVEEQRDVLTAFLQKVGVNATGTAMLDVLADAPIDAQAFNQTFNLKVARLDDGRLFIKTNHESFHAGYPKIYRRCGATQYLRRYKAWAWPEDAQEHMVAQNLAQECGFSEGQIQVLEGVYKIIEREDNSFAFRPVANFGDTISAPSPGGLPVEKGSGKDGDQRVDAELPGGRALRPEEERWKARLEALPLDAHQKRNALFFAARLSGANFSEQGTGKTRTMIAALMVSGRDDQQHLIVAPKNTLEGWEDEIRILEPDARVSIGRYESQARWIIVNPERLEAMVPHAGCFASLTFDEAHKIKSEKARVSKLTLALGEHIPRAYVLTGTPLPNKEEELLNLLRLTQHPIGELSRKEFKQAYTGCAENREALHRELTNWYVRDLQRLTVRLKPKTRVIERMKPSEKFRAYYNEIIDAKDAYLAAKRAAFFRLLASFKLEWVIQKIQQLPADEKFIIFTDQKQIIPTIEQRLGKIGISVVVSTGDTDSFRAIRELRDNEGVRGMVATLSGNSEGVNMQRANHAFFLNLPWTAAQLLQAEARIFRKGQNRATFIHVPLVEGTYDESMVDFINIKSMISNQVFAENDEEHAKYNRKRVSELIQTASYL